MQKVAKYKRNDATIFDDSETGLAPMREQWNKVVSVCAVAFEVSAKDIVGRSRIREIVDARHAACHLAWKKHGWSIVTIAKLLGRDHSTISHSLKVTEILLESLFIFGKRYGTSAALLDVDARSKEAALLNAHEKMTRLRSAIKEMEKEIGKARRTIEQLQSIVEKYSSIIEDHDYENTSVGAPGNVTAGTTPPSRSVAAVSGL